MHNNNFDFLRFVFATCVVLTHSYGLLNESFNDPLMLLTKDQMSMSYVGLSGFFIISGYLIYESYKRSNSVSNFLWKRFVRIFPGIFVATTLTVILCGLFITSVPASLYFSNIDVYFYIVKNSTLLFDLEMYLPGVFQNNPYRGVVNGSIWTIGYEIFFYLLLTSLFILKKFDNKYFFMVLYVFTIIMKSFLEDYKWLSIPYSTLNIYHMVSFAQFFLSGMILNAIGFKLKKRQYQMLLVLCIITLSLTTYYNILNVVYVVLFPIVVIILSKHKSLLNNFGKYGDISYGVYIYSFLIQQSIISLFPGFSALQIFFYSMGLSILIALLSWHFIEKKALSYKNLVN